MKNKLQEMEKRRLELETEDKDYLEKAIKKELADNRDFDNREDNDNEEHQSNGEFGKAMEEEIIIGNENPLSDSDDENDSIYDVEGRDDTIDDLRMVDLRKYKYAIDKKLIFAKDEDEELKKIRYIFKELLLDIGIGRFGFRSSLISIIIMLLALWSRMYIHYLFQYIFLKAFNVPVTNVEIKAHTVKIDYGYWNVYQEVIAVSFGVLGTTLSF